MKHNKTKINPPGKLHGGKSYLARRLINLFPESDSGPAKYVEPYGGLASCMLNMPAATREKPRIDVYNDLNFALFNLFNTIRNLPNELTRQLTLTPYSEVELQQASRHLQAHQELITDNHEVCNVELARLQFILLQMSFGGQGKAGSASFSRTKDRTRRGIADVVSGYLATIHDHLPAIIERVTEWQIENRPALQCIDYHDKCTTFFYCDPPYHPDCRTSPEVYEHEMTGEQHEAFADRMQNIRGLCAISHYPHRVYDRLLNKDWKRHDFPIANHAAGGKEKKRMTECVYTNF
jgi:DNA adenine methylase